MNTGKSWCVYKHTAPNGKVYIGITSKSPEQRWKNGNGYSNQLFGRAIAKYGWENIQHEIIESNLNECDAKKLEKQLIKKYKSNEKLFGYNVSDGGVCVCGVGLKRVCQYTIDGEYIKTWESATEVASELGLFASNINGCCNGALKTYGGFIWKREDDEVDPQINHYKKRTYLYSINGDYLREFESTKEAAEHLNVGKTQISKYCRNETSYYNKYIFSYRKLDKINKHCNKTKSNIQNPINIKHKPIYQYTLSGEFVKEWKSVDEVSEAYNCSKSNIYNACAGYSKSSLGYIWSYKDECNLRVKSKEKQVYQYDVSGNLIRSFKSVSEASREYGFSFGNIAKCCRGECKKSYNYIWSYNMLLNT